MRVQRFFRVTGYALLVTVMHKPSIPTHPPLHSGHGLRVIRYESSQTLHPHTPTPPFRSRVTHYSSRLRTNPPSPHTHSSIPVTGYGLLVTNHHKPSIPTHPLLHSGHGSRITRHESSQTHHPNKLPCPNAWPSSSPAAVATCRPSSTRSRPVGWTRRSRWWCPIAVRPLA